MKRLLSSIIALSYALSGCAPTDSELTPAQSAEIETEVVSAFEGLTAAAKAGNVVEYFDYFDPDTFTSLNADGSTFSSFDDFKRSIEPQLELVVRYETLEFEPVTLNVISPNSAVLVNEYTAEIVIESERIVSVAGSGAQFWVKRDDAWKLVHVSNFVKD